MKIHSKGNVVLTRSHNLNTIGNVDTKHNSDYYSRISNSMKRSNTTTGYNKSIFSNKILRPTLLKSSTITQTELEEEKSKPNRSKYIRFLKNSITSITEIKQGYLDYSKSLKIKKDKKFESFGKSGVLPSIKKTLNKHSTIDFPNVEHKRVKSIDIFSMNYKAQGKILLERTYKLKSIVNYMYPKMFSLKIKKMNLM